MYEHCSQTMPASLSLRRRLGHEGTHLQSQWTQDLKEVTRWTHLQTPQVLGSATVLNRKNKLCACCICAVHWRHLWGFFAQSPTSVLGKFATWFSDNTWFQVSNGVQWSALEWQATHCAKYNNIYNFPEYKTTPQAFGSVASHPILTVAARYTDLHNTLIYIDLYRFTLIYTACFVVVQRLSDSRIFKPFGQLVGFVHGCSWGLGRVELGPTVAKSGSSISCTCSKRSWEPVPWQIRKVDTLGYSRIKLTNLHDYYGRVRRESEVLNHLKNELTKHET